MNVEVYIKVDIVVIVIHRHRHRHPSSSSSIVIHRHPFPSSSIVIVIHRHLHHHLCHRRRYALNPHIFRCILGSPEAGLSVHPSIRMYVCMAVTTIKNPKMRSPTELIMDPFEVGGF